MCWVVDVRGELLLSPSGLVLMCFLEFWISVGQLFELSRHSTCSLREFYWNCSVLVPELWSWNPFGGDIWLATSVNCFFSRSWVVWLVLLAESFCSLSRLWWLTGVSGGCCQLFSGNGGNPVVLAVSVVAHAVPEGRRRVPSLRLGPQLGHLQFYWSVCLVVDFDFAPRVFYSEEAVYLLNSLHNNIFLWKGSFCHRSHRVGLQFLVFCHFGGLHCWFSFNSLSGCDTKCSLMPFSNWVRLIDFCRWRDILVYMNCAFIDWAATRNATFASFWISSKKSIDFWFDGLKTNH